MPSGNIRVVAAEVATDANVRNVREDARMPDAAVCGDGQDGNVRLSRGEARFLRVCCPACFPGGCGCRVCFPACRFPDGCGYRCCRVCFPACRFPGGCDFCCLRGVCFFRSVSAVGIVLCCYDKCGGSVRSCPEKPNRIESGLQPLATTIFFCLSFS